METLKAIVAVARPQVQGDKLVTELSRQTIAEAIRPVLTLMLGRPRRQAKQAVSAANLKQIGFAILAWASKHKDQAPPDLQVLVKEGLITDRNLVNPLRPDKEGYVYIRPQKPLTNASADLIIAYEAHEEFADGVTALYANGSVKYFGRETDFQAALKAALKAASAPAEADQPADVRVKD